MATAPKSVADMTQEFTSDHQQWSPSDKKDPAKAGLFNTANQPQLTTSMEKPDIPSRLRMAIINVQKAWERPSDLYDPYEEERELLAASIDALFAIEQILEATERIRLAVEPTPETYPLNS